MPLWLLPLLWPLLLLLLLLLLWPLLLLLPLLWPLLLLLPLLWPCTESETPWTGRSETCHTSCQDC